MRNFSILLTVQACLCCGLFSVIMIFREIYGNLGKEDLADDKLRELVKTIPGFILIILPYILMQIRIFR